MFALLFLLGHFVGDYFFQTNKMAMSKTKWDIGGWSACIIHSIIYSITFTIAMMFTGKEFNYIGLVTWTFISHFPIDKVSFAKYIMNALGRPLPGQPQEASSATVSWIVYVVIDNVLHLIFMLLGIYLLFPELLP